VLAKAWAGASEVAEQSAKAAPGERSLLAFGAHQLARDLSPVVAVTIGSCPCVELAFTLHVTADFSGVKLALADGHIVGGEAGEAWASAQLSLQGVPLHQPAESPRLAFGGPFEFAAPGVAIPGLASAAI
jgi:hypothetical protein